MLSNYYTLRYLTSLLAPELDGRYLTGAFSQEKNQLVLSFDKGAENLVISCQPDQNACFLQHHFERAHRNSVDLFKGCVGSTVHRISLVPGDRVIVMDLGAGSCLLVQFFGSLANVIFVDSGNTILEAFKRGKTRDGQEAARPRGEMIFDFPSLRQAMLDEVSTTVFSVIRKTLPSIGTTLSRECLHRADLELSATAKNISEAEFGSLQRGIISVLDDLATPEARVYLTASETPEKFSIIPLRHLEQLTERLFPDLHEGIRFFLSRKRAGTEVEQSKSSALSLLGQQIEKARHTVAAMESDRRDGLRSDDYELFGSLLMTNLADLVGGAAEITLPGERGETRIALDPLLSPVRNAQRYFEKAKRSRRAEQEASARVKLLQARILRGERLRSGLDPAHTRDEVKKYMTEHEKEMEEFGIGKKGRAREIIPFRVFTVDGGFKVWAGKSSTNNDLLTLKHATPHDLWFHVRGSGGSHVVLKVASAAGEPGKKAREQAAGIAAYYSKMKNASMVPVAMTEKKFVRKPKGAPPGTVVLDREKVIFAAPALPDMLTRTVEGT